MTKPKYIQLSRRAGFRLQQTSRDLNGLPAISCARPGIYGNPFIVGKHGTTAECVYFFKKLCTGLICMSVDSVCINAQYRFAEKAVPKINAGELRGKNLCCWCKPGEKCHVQDVLLPMANV